MNARPANGAQGYSGGAEMWRECCLRYGDAEARTICNRYLNMQIHTTSQEELQFCRQLYLAMQTAVAYGGELHE